MSTTAPQPVPNPHLAAELTRIAVDGAFTEAARVMRENDLDEAAITHEFMAHALDRMMGDAADLDLLRGKAHALVSDIVDGVSDAMGGEQPSGRSDTSSASTLDPEACFIARLALDMTLATFKVNNGNVSLNGSQAVVQAIGLFQETKRQLADVRAGEFTIRDAAKPA